jgi:hypothetical protein
MKIKLKEDFDFANLKENPVEVVCIKITSG